MIVIFSTILLTMCTAGASFNIASPSHLLIGCNLSWSSPVQALCASPSDYDSTANDDLLDVSGEETVLRINFSFDSNYGSSALAAVQTYTKSFPFAAVLPVQPLTYLPGESSIAFLEFHMNHSHFSREIFPLFSPLFTPNRKNDRWKSSCASFISKEADF